MKRNKIFILCTVMLFAVSMLFSGCQKNGDGVDMSGKVKVMSYNVLVDWCTEYEGSEVTNKYDFTARMPKITKLFKDEKPDSFGVQECSLPIKQALMAGLADYDYVGTMDTGGENDANAFGTFIFYNKTKYKVVETKNFWLTATPDVVSTYPGSDRPRNGQWVILENLTTGEQYAHINVHVEWKTKASNTFGSKYTRKVMDQLAEKDIPVFCTGDFNVESDKYDTVEIMTKEGDVSIKDSQTVAKETVDTHSTHFDVPGWKIDYIFVTDQKMDVEKYSQVGDYTMSDHLGVKVIATLKK